MVSYSCSEEEEIVAGNENLIRINSETINNENPLNIVTEWTNLLVDIEQYSSGRPNVSARAMAYIYLASYETAVDEMDGYASIENKLKGFNINHRAKPEGLHIDIALNACFSSVTKHFLLNLPQQYIEQINNMESEQHLSLIPTIDQDVVSNSTAWGEYIAEEIIKYSQTDNEAEQQMLAPQPRSYEPEAAPGYWTYSADQERALFPYWESVRTFVISPKKTTSIAPAVYSTEVNSPYYAEMMEAYLDNNDAKNGNDEALWIAEFWSDDVEGLMISPPVRQISIANQLAEQSQLSLAETLELMLKVGFSLNDAAVATWKYKYEYMVMRPNIYIQEHIDADYQTNLYRLIYWPNPSFPGYPSGHSAFASAAGGVFIDFFGNNVNFTDYTHASRTEFRGTPRTFSTITSLASENAFSRVPLGVHMPMDCEEGLRLGYEISDAINAYDIRNNRSHSL